ncbi:class I SAM-dependent methyltransferase [Ruegeria sp. 6PALISEP08]|uniref:class I SAM-dependent methyltransferase n=1 Tax=Ruegeria sp. 6PALISEP08 TaxID=1225660 RepID=UPI00067EED5B|nr:class I SAM-dependent methyltransferase [Ruegeria sp. 6PALISEP08]
MARTFVDKLEAIVLPTPKMGIESFERDPNISYVSSDSPLSQGPLHSEIARTGRLNSKQFRACINELRLSHVHHRKHWEFAFILEVLRERGLLKRGMKGLGFAVGKERIPAYLAAHGCEVLASDLADDNKGNKGWDVTGQWSAAVEDLMFPDICSNEILRKNVKFRPIDMNHIPNDVSGFDFTWSTCSFEHCGSLELGIRFLENQMNCLRPGGVAVHTTEFNLSSNSRTSKGGKTAIYRLRDIEDAVKRLQDKGHTVEPLDIRLGDDPLDRTVDRRKGDPRQYSDTKHMRLLLNGYATTSIGLIIAKST